MATRRVYKPRKAYRDGGAVIADDVVPTAALGADVPPAQPSPPDIPPAQPSDAILRALEATRHAEEMQRQGRQQQPTQQQIIDATPGLTLHKRDFLKAHPEMFFDPVTRQAAAFAYRAALADSVEDDTPEMNERILDGVRREMGLRHQQGVDAARAATPMAAMSSMSEPSIEHSAHRLDLEAAAMRMSAATAARPLPIAADMPAPAPPRRSSMPVSAPVSRDVPSASGRRMSDMRSITLSAEERDIARRSYSAPDMTDDDKERAYAAAKSMMLARRSAGTLNE